MNRSIDPTPATGPTHESDLCRSGCDAAKGGGATRQTPCATQDSIQLKLLDTLVQKIIEALAENSCKVRVSDALKAIQLREKVAKKSEAEQIFWQMIEEIKAEGPPGSHPELTPLQRKIQAAILPLRDCVKNAILPVKAITESFNSTRSEQARLTTRRMGKLLAGMGFTVVKASNGSSAIIWDDDILPPRPPSDPADTGVQGKGLSSPLVGEELKSKIPPFDRLRVVSEVEPPSAGERMGFSSPLVGEELKSKIPPEAGVRGSSLSSSPIGEHTAAGQTGDSTPEDFIQGLDVLPQNPPTPLPWENTESLSSPTYPEIHPGSPPLDFSRRLALSSGGINRMVHPRPGGAGNGPSSPLVGEELKSKIPPSAGERGNSSRSKPAIEKNKNKAQNPLKALKHQFPASRDPPKR